MASGKYLEVPVLELVFLNRKSISEGAVARGSAQSQV